MYNPWNATNDDVRGANETYFIARDPEDNGLVLIEDRGFEQKIIWKSDKVGELEWLRREMVMIMTVFARDI